ncbi:tetratricopeptide repeat protein 33 isoform X1 [Momordica charantia]|uniref:Tetratricopeptide repeat protein 33 isoform X1 n=1 Tax=Momordica charantia TaxID=3673 RepID=A0A6J1CJJ3_MOMCH|nr:tetratricopeptide repeat protein 33 isoform X1 [Momordica charantia]
MKLTWKNKSNTRKRSLTAISSRSNLPFEVPGAGEVEDDSAYNRQDKEVNLEAVDRREDESSDCSSDLKRLAESFQAQGDRLAEDGKFREALGKWENALTLMPGNAVLHEQKAQVLLEVGEAWGALKAASRATDLDPSWAEAWITLGRAQLNFGEPDSAIESFDRALAIKPDSGDARGDRQTALHLIKRRKQLHSAGLSSTENRYLVRDKSKDSDIHEE